MQQYSFGEKLLSDHILLVTGPSRTGKTTLCRILGSCKHVIWIEEPYALAELIILYGSGAFEDKRLFERALGGALNDLIVNSVLYRNANFRPEDLSFVGRYKPDSDIRFHLETLKTRQDVNEYILGVNPLFIFDIPDVLLYVNDIKSAFPQIKVLCQIRDGMQVAEAAYVKHWFQSEPYVTRDTCNFVVELNGNDYQIPYFVAESDWKKFIDCDEYNRCLLYWVSIMQALDTVRDDIDYFVLFDEMMQAPEITLFNLINQMNLVKGKLSDRLIGELHPEMSDFSEHLVDDDIYDRYKHIFGELRTIVQTKEIS